MEMMLAQMVSLAATMHEGQVDKGDMPYIFHVVEVARRVMEKYNDAELACIAAGHDLIEDTPMTAEQLLREGFTPRIVKGIETLSKNGKSYEQYKAGVLSSIDAIRVKYEDIGHNTDTIQLKHDMTEEDIARLRKYYAFKSELVKAAIEYNRKSVRLIR